MKMVMDMSELHKEPLNVIYQLGHDNLDILTCIKLTTSIYLLYLSLLL